jgi:hypothetical protein
VTAPSYTTDLAVVWDATNNTGWSELTGHTSGSADAYETDYFIQRSGCVSQATGVATGQTTGLEYDYGSNITIASGDCFFFWQIFLAPNAIATWANGGMRIVIGSSSGNVNHWNAMGSDFGKYPYGGWQNTAIDPTYTRDGFDGTTNGNYRIFGSHPNLVSSVSKGNPHGVDAIRWGRGELIIEFGATADGYGTFAGIAAQNDSQNNRWGLFQKQGIVYLWKGLMSFGNATNACDFRDSNVNVSIDDTPRTYAAFNRIVISNASSKVYWTGVSFQSANASGLSLGEFEMADNADVQLDGCSFTDMSTFTLLSNIVATGTTWRRCNTITTTGGSFLGCTVAASEAPTNGSAFVWNSANDPDGYLDGMTFTKGAHAATALKMGASSPSSITLRDMTFTGYSVSNGDVDAVIYLADKGSDTNWTINASGCSGTVSYYKERSGDTVTVNVDQVTATFEVRDADGALITDSTEITLVRSSDLTVLYHAEDVTTGSTSHTYGYSGDVTCYLNVLSVANYVPRTVEPVVLGASDQTVVVQLEDERGRYNNP